MRRSALLGLGGVVSLGGCMTSVPDVTNTGLASGGDGPGTQTSGGDPTVEPPDSVGDAEAGDEEGETTATASGGSTTTGEIDLSTSGPPPTTTDGTTGALDACPHANVGALPWSFSGSTEDEEHDFVSTCGGAGAPDVAFTFTAPADGSYSIDTAGSSLDTVLAVFDGMCEGDLIECNDDNECGMGEGSGLVVTLAADQTVTIVVDSFALNGGDFEIHVEECVDCEASGDGIGCGSGSGSGSQSGSQS